MEGRGWGMEGGGWRVGTGGLKVKVECERRLKGGCRICDSVNISAINIMF